MTRSALHQRLRSIWSRLAMQGFWFHRPDHRSAENTHHLRRYARKFLLRQWPPAARPVAAFLATLIWPFSSYREAIHLARHSNPDAVDKHLKWGVWRAALRHNLPPAEYGAFGGLRSGAAAPDSFLYTREASVITARLTAQSVRDLVGDKIAFAEFCARRGRLNVAETLAVFKERTALRAFSNDMPPCYNLISKPVRASMGRGLDLWTFQSDGFVPSFDPHLHIATTNMANTLAVRSQSSPSGLMVQPALSTHTNLADVSHTGPAVVRIVTGRWKDGTVEALNAMIQRPTTGAFKTHGGPFRLIDLQSGQTINRMLGPHIFPSATDDPVFDNIQVPDWMLCIDALIDLHAILEDQAPLIGWDMIFTPNGPTILEANTTLAPYFFQLATQRPACDGKWMTLLAEYLP